MRETNPIRRVWPRQYYRWTTPLEFQLFAAKRQPEIANAGSERKAVKKGGKRVDTRTLAITRFVPDWSDDISVQVTSMVLTDNAVFVAGPPDLEDEEESVRTLLDPETQRKLAEQSAAFEGERGALLVAVSRDDGKKLAAYRLDFVPRFDGLIAANGRLYISTLGGEVLCLGEAWVSRLRQPKMLSWPHATKSHGDSCLLSYQSKTKAPERLCWKDSRFEVDVSIFWMTISLLSMEGPYRLINALTFTSSGIGTDLQRDQLLPPFEPGPLSTIAVSRETMTNDTGVRVGRPT